MTVLGKWYDNNGHTCTSDTGKYIILKFELTGAKLFIFFRCSDKRYGFLLRFVVYSATVGRSKAQNSLAYSAT